MAKHTRWYWINDGRFLVTGDGAGPHINSRVVLELPEGAEVAPEVRAAIAAMPMLYDALEDMLGTHSSEPDLSNKPMAWLDARARAVVALNAAGGRRDV